MWGVCRQWDQPRRIHLQAPNSPSSFVCLRSRLLMPLARRPLGIPQDCSLACQGMGILSFLPVLGKQHLTFPKGVFLANWEKTKPIFHKHIEAWEIRNSRSAQLSLTHFQPSVVSLAQTLENQPQNLLLTLFWLNWVLNKHALSWKSTWVCLTFRPARNPNAFLKIIPHDFLEGHVNGRGLWRQEVRVQVPSYQWQAVWPHASYLPCLRFHFLLLKWGNKADIMNCQQDKKNCKHLGYPFPLNHKVQVPRSTYPPGSSACIYAPYSRFWGPSPDPWL